MGGNLGLTSQNGEGSPSFFPAPQARLPPSPAATDFENSMWTCFCRKLHTGRSSFHHSYEKKHCIVFWPSIKMKLTFHSFCGNWSSAHLMLKTCVCGIHKISNARSPFLSTGEIVICNIHLYRESHQRWFDRAICQMQWWTPVHHTKLIVSKTLNVSRYYLAP